MNEIHCALLELGEQKKAVLISNKINELSMLLKQESKLMKRITECEREWLDATVQFLHDKGLHPNPSITISELVKMVFQPEEKSALLLAQRDLLETIAKLKQVNGLNQGLIEQSLAFIEYSLDLFTGSFEQDAIYYNPAQQTQGKKSFGTFDSKI